ncbi:MAG TPA: hypothetical protein VEH29_13615 [Acidimicrobiales bacterium]|nr:hypothetical protein [Acidimicrobiales bacterium]
MAELPPMTTPSGTDRPRRVAHPVAALAKPPSAVTVLTSRMAGSS